MLALTLHCVVHSFFEVKVAKLSLLQEKKQFFKKCENEKVEY